MTTARELLEAALNSGVLMHATSPKDVIQTNTPGLSVDGSLMRQRLVEGIERSAAGAELLRRADEARVAEGLCGYPGCASLIPDGQPGHRDADYVHRCLDEEMHAEAGDTGRCHPFLPAPRPPEPDRAAALVHFALGQWVTEGFINSAVDESLYMTDPVYKAIVYAMNRALAEPAPVADCVTCGQPFDKHAGYGDPDYPAHRRECPEPAPVADGTVEG